MTLHDARRQLLFQLYALYDNREAGQIADMVLEYLTGWNRIDRVINKMVPLLRAQEDSLEKFTLELLQHKPIQYVLNESWFAGMRLYVDERVLIPRPETEELVDWIVKDNQGQVNLESIKMLDIGTGSGCIALGLKKGLPVCDVQCCDISEGALQVAKQNAFENNLFITFYLIDILKKEEYGRLPSFDLIVSNPPYISIKEKNEIEPNVLNYEPHVALFVEDDEPMLFYKAILLFARTNLTKTGTLYFEVHEKSAKSIVEMIVQEGFSVVEIRKDMQGKERMIKASGSSH